MNITRLSNHTSAQPSPWSTITELEEVYASLYAFWDPELQKSALHTIAIWRTRSSKLPLSVESTAALISLHLGFSTSRFVATEDYLQIIQSPKYQHVFGNTINNNSTFNLTADLFPQSNDVMKLRYEYSMVLIRFVNGIVDPAQKKATAMSVSYLASTIGIPRTLVDMRHEATHNALPSLAALAAAGGKALQWLQQNYWEQQIISWSERRVAVAELLAEYRTLAKSSYKMLSREGKEIKERIEARQMINSITGISGSTTNSSGTPPTMSMNKLKKQAQIQAQIHAQSQIYFTQYNQHTYQQYVYDFSSLSATLQIIKQTVLQGLFNKHQDVISFLDPWRLPIPPVIAPSWIVHPKPPSHYEMIATTPKWGDMDKLHGKELGQEQSQNQNQDQDHEERDQLQGVAGVPELSSIMSISDISNNSSENNSDYDNSGNHREILTNSLSTPSLSSFKSTSSNRFELLSPTSKREKVHQQLLHEKDQRNMKNMKTMKDMTDIDPITKSPTSSTSNTIDSYELYTPYSSISAALSTVLPYCNPVDMINELEDAFSEMIGNVSISTSTSTDVDMTIDHNANFTRKRKHSLHNRNLPQDEEKPNQVNECGKLQKIIHPPSFHNITVEVDAADINTAATPSLTSLLLSTTSPDVSMQSTKSTKSTSSTTLPRLFSSSELESAFSSLTLSTSSTSNINTNTNTNILQPPSTPLQRTNSLINSPKIPSLSPSRLSSLLPQPPPPPSISVLSPITTPVPQSMFLGCLASSIPSPLLHSIGMLLCETSGFMRNSDGKILYPAQLGGMSSSKPSDVSDDTNNIDDQPILTLSDETIVSISSKWTLQKHPLTLGAETGSINSNIVDKSTDKPTPSPRLPYRYLPYYYILDESQYLSIISSLPTISSQHSTYNAFASQVSQATTSPLSVMGGGNIALSNLSNLSNISYTSPLFQKSSDFLSHLTSLFPNSNSNLSTTIAWSIPTFLFPLLLSTESGILRIPINHSLQLPNISRIRTVMNSEAVLFMPLLRTLSTYMSHFATSFIGALLNEIKRLEVLFFHIKRIKIVMKRTRDAFLKIAKARHNRYLHIQQQVQQEELDELENREAKGGESSDGRSSDGDGDEQDSSIPNNEYKTLMKILALYYTDECRKEHDIYSRYTHILMMLLSECGFINKTIPDDIATESVKKSNLHTLNTLSMSQFQSNMNIRGNSSLLDDFPQNDMLNNEDKSSVKNHLFENLQSTRNDYTHTMARLVRHLSEYKVYTVKDLQKEDKNNSKHDQDVENHTNQTNQTNLRTSCKDQGEQNGEDEEDDENDASSLSTLLSLTLTHPSVTTDNHIFTNPSPYFTHGLHPKGLATIYKSLHLTLDLDTMRERLQQLDTYDDDETYDDGEHDSNCADEYADDLSEPLALEMCDDIDDANVNTNLDEDMKGKYNTITVKTATETTPESTMIMNYNIDSDSSDSDNEDNRNDTNDGGDSDSDDDNIDYYEDEDLNTEPLIQRYQVYISPDFDKAEEYVPSLSGEFEEHIIFPFIVCMFTQTVELMSVYWENEFRGIINTDQDFSSQFYSSLYEEFQRYYDRLHWTIKYATELATMLLQPGAWDVVNIGESTEAGIIGTDVNASISTLAASTTSSISSNVTNTMSLTTATATSTITPSGLARSYSTGIHRKVSGSGNSGGGSTNTNVNTNLNSSLPTIPLSSLSYHFPAPPPITSAHKLITSVNILTIISTAIRTFDFHVKQIFQNIYHIQLEKILFLMKKQAREGIEREGNEQEKIEQGQENIGETDVRTDIGTGIYELRYKMIEDLERNYNIDISTRDSTPQSISTPSLPTAISSLFSRAYADLVKTTTSITQLHTLAHDNSYLAFGMLTGASVDISLCSVLGNGAKLHSVPFQSILQSTSQSSIAGKLDQELHPIKELKSQLRKRGRIGVDATTTTTTNVATVSSPNIPHFSPLNSQSTVVTPLNPHELSILQLSIASSMSNIIYRSRYIYEITLLQHYLAIATQLIREYEDVVKFFEQYTTLTRDNYYILLDILHSISSVQSKTVHISNTSSASLTTHTELLCRSTIGTLPNGAFPVFFSCHPVIFKHYLSCFDVSNLLSNRLERNQKRFEKLLIKKNAKK